MAGCLSLLKGPRSASLSSSLKAAMPFKRYTSDFIAASLGCKAGVPAAQPSPYINTLGLIFSATERIWRIVSMS